jgi:Zinc finger, C2H2 type
MGGVSRDAPVHITDGRLGIFDDTPSTPPAQGGGHLFDSSFGMAPNQPGEPGQIGSPTQTGSSAQPDQESARPRDGNSHLSPGAVDPALSGGKGPIAGALGTSPALAAATGAFVQDADTLFATSSVAAAAAAARALLDAHGPGANRAAASTSASKKHGASAAPLRSSKRVRRSTRIAADADADYAPDGGGANDDDGGEASSESMDSSPRARAKATVARQLDDGTRTHICVHPGCGKTFTKKYNLNAHLRLHSNEQPFECLKCGKKFRWKSSITFHETHAHKR